MESNSSSSLERRLAIQWENPFAFKVGQVFTGFGIGCGVGIGVGRPLNIGAIPALQQVASAARGATDTFSGLGRHVNGSLRRLGAKNIEAGFGCGVGFGHGFGVGLAIKPGVLYNIQTCIGGALAKMMMKFGVVPSLSSFQSTLSGSLKSNLNVMDDTKMQSPVGNIMQMASKSPEHTSQGNFLDVGMDMGSIHEPFASKKPPSNKVLGSRSEQVISSFLRDPILKDEEALELKKLVGRLHSENNILLMVLKHQQVIDELMEENEKLHQVLIEELKVSPSKLKASNTSITKSLSQCSNCFECRRRRRNQR